MISWLSWLNKGPKHVSKVASRLMRFAQLSSRLIKLVKSVSHHIEFKVYWKVCLLNFLILNQSRWKSWGRKKKVIIFFQFWVSWDESRLMKCWQFWQCGLEIFPGRSICICSTFFNLLLHILPQALFQLLLSVLQHVHTISKRRKVLTRSPWHEAHHDRSKSDAG